MDALACQNIRQTNPRRQYLYPDLASLRGGDVFLGDSDHFGAAVLGDDNSFVAHFPVSEVETDTSAGVSA